MSRSQTPIRVNAPAVAFEIIEDEAIVINFESGAYHSLRGVALRVWQQIAATTSAERLAAAMMAHYEGDPDEIRRSLDSFVGELESSDLITFDPSATIGSGPSGRPNGRVPFAPPVIETFGDMQDYLLMDPVHEVDATGWPNALPTPDQE